MRLKIRTYDNTIEEAMCTVALDRAIDNTSVSNIVPRHSYIRCDIVTTNNITIWGTYDGRRTVTQKYEVKP